MYVASTLIKILEELRVYFIPVFFEIYVRDALKIFDLLNFFRRCKDKLAFPWDAKSLCFHLKL